MSFEKWRTHSYQSCNVSRKHIFNIRYVNVSQKNEVFPIIDFWSPTSFPNLFYHKTHAKIIIHVHVTMVASCCEEKAILFNKGVVQFPSNFLSLITRHISKWLCVSLFSFLINHRKTYAKTTATIRVTKVVSLFWRNAFIYYNGEVHVSSLFYNHYRIYANRTLNIHFINLASFVIEITYFFFTTE